MKEIKDKWTDQGTKEGNLKGGKGSNQKTEPKKKTDSGKTSK